MIPKISKKSAKNSWNHFSPKREFFFFLEIEKIAYFFKILDHYALHHIILKSNKNCHFKRVDTVANKLWKGTFYFRGVPNDKYQNLVFGFFEMKCHGQIKCVKDISKTRNQSFEFLIPVTGHSFEILDIFAKRFFPPTDRSNYIFYPQNLTNFVFFW